MRKKFTTSSVSPVNTRVRIIDSASKDELFDKGQLVIGAQRHGYHEYILSGEDIKE